MPVAATVPRTQHLLTPPGAAPRFVLMTAEWMPAEAAHVLQVCTHERILRLFKKQPQGAN
jgi:hypothetical protein